MATQDFMAGIGNPMAGVTNQQQTQPTQPTKSPSNLPIMNMSSAAGQQNAPVSQQSQSPDLSSSLNQPTPIQGRVNPTPIYNQQNENDIRGVVYGITQAGATPDQLIQKYPNLVDKFKPLADMMSDIKSGSGQDQINTAYPEFSPTLKNDVYGALAPQQTQQPGTTDQSGQTTSSAGGTQTPESSTATGLGDFLGGKPIDTSKEFSKFMDPFGAKGTGGATAGTALSLVSKTLLNIIPNVTDFVKGVGSMIFHPGQTIDSIKTLGQGIIDKTQGKNTPQAAMAGHMRDGIVSTVTDPAKLGTWLTENPGQVIAAIAGVGAPEEIAAGAIKLAKGAVDVAGNIPGIAAKVGEVAGKVGEGVKGATSVVEKSIREGKLPSVSTDGITKLKNAAAEKLQSSANKLNPQELAKYKSKVGQSIAKTQLEEGMAGSHQELFDQSVAKSKDAQAKLADVTKGIKTPVRSELAAKSIEHIISTTDKKIPGIEDKLKPYQEQAQRLRDGTASFEDLQKAKTMQGEFQNTFDQYGHVPQGDLEKKQLADNYANMKGQLEQIAGSHGIDIKALNHDIMKFEGMRRPLGNRLAKDANSDVFSLTDNILGAASIGHPGGFGLLAAKKIMGSPSVKTKIANALYKKTGETGMKPRQSLTTNP